jgi:hypothetical protein
MICLLLGFLPAGSEWLILTPIVFYIYYRIFKFIRSLFK